MKTLSILQERQDGSAISQFNSKRSSMKNRNLSLFRSSSLVLTIISLLSITRKCFQRHIAAMWRLSIIKQLTKSQIFLDTNAVYKSKDLTEIKNVLFVLNSPRLENGWEIENLNNWIFFTTLSEDIMISL